MSLKKDYLTRGKDPWSEDDVDDFMDDMDKTASKAVRLGFLVILFQLFVILGGFAAAVWLLLSLLQHFDVLLLFF